MLQAMGLRAVLADLGLQEGALQEGQGVLEQVLAEERVLEQGWEEDGGLG